MTPDAAWAQEAGVPAPGRWTAGHLENAAGASQVVEVPEVPEVADPVGDDPGGDDPVAETSGADVEWAQGTEPVEDWAERPGAAQTHETEGGAGPPEPEGTAEWVGSPQADGGSGPAEEDLNEGAGSGMMADEGVGGTGHPAVDAALRAVVNAEALPVAEQLAAYEGAHQTLREVLASIED